MTQCEWIEEQYEQYGYDYINELMDKGYEPIHTQLGWRWILMSKVTVKS